MSKKLVDYLRRRSAENAVSAATKRADYRKLASKQQIQQLGDMLLEDNIVTPLSTPSGIANRLDNAKVSAGQTIGNLLDIAPHANVDMEKVALNLMDDPEIAALHRVPGGEGTANQVDKFLETLASNKEMPLKDAQRLRQLVDKQVNHNKAIPEMRGSQPYLNKIARSVSDAMSDQIDNVAGTSGALKEANQKYSRLTALDKMADARAAQDASNRTFGLTDTIAGAAGVASGNPILPAVLAGANKLGRTFGDSFMANAQRSVERKLRAIPRFASLAESNPKGFQMLVQSMAKRLEGGGAPQLVPKYADDDQDRGLANSLVPHDEAIRRFSKGN